jgi:hypothetical protein
MRRQNLMQKIELLVHSSVLKPPKVVGGVLVQGVRGNPISILLLEDNLAGFGGWITDVQHNILALNYSKHDVSADGWSPLH